MAQQTINVGSAPNDSTGDPIRTAWTKANANFTEIYAGLLEPPQGRLTLASATPVMTSTVVGATTIYYTPYVGNIVPIYDGTNMNATAFSELSVALSDTTKSPAAIGVSKVNDWFVWNDAGTIRLGHGPDWASDTARTDALVRTNGIWLNNVAITNGPAAQRGTYVGTTRSNASSQLDWKYGTVGAPPGETWLGVWNCYNRIDVSAFNGEATSNWTYSSTTPRSANGQATYRAGFVVGLSEDSCLGIYATHTAISTNAGTVGIGFDSTTAFSSSSAAQSNNATSQAPAGANLMLVPPIGFHFINALESANAAGAAAFYGNFQQTLGKLFFAFRM